MSQPFTFPIADFRAVYVDGTVELQHGGDTVIWMTFFENGVFTVREPGRGHAGRFPSSLLAADVHERVAFALGTFARRAA
jgi:hypothetical protein